MPGKKSKNYSGFACLSRSFPGTGSLVDDAHVVVVGVQVSAKGSVSSHLGSGRGKHA